MEAERDLPDNFRNRCIGFWSNHWAGVVIIIAPIALLPILFLDLYSKVYRYVYLYCLMAVYWLTKVIPGYVTALFPAMLLPVMGILHSDTVCMMYFSDPVILFFGSALVALAIQYCNIDKRVALAILMTVGKSPSKIIAALIFTTGFISMWIPNGATTIMMSGIARAVIDDLNTSGVIRSYEEGKENQDFPPASRAASAIFLSIAYAATIGGVGSLIGTPTNAALMGMYAMQFPKDTKNINFPMFTAYTFLLTVLMLSFLCIWMHLIFFSKMNLRGATGKLGSEENSEVRRQYNELGSITCHEMQVIVIFLVMLGLLIFLRPGFTTGLDDLLTAQVIQYSWPVILAALALFILPMHYRCCKHLYGSAPFTDKETTSLLSWKYAVNNFSWGAIFIVGAGMALTSAMIESQTSKSLEYSLEDIPSMPKWVLQLGCIILVVIVSAFTWNTLSSCLILPLVGQLAISHIVHPLYLLLPVGVAANYSFLLPIATPPNEIASTLGNVRTRHMLLAGIGPTIFAIILVFINGQVLHQILFPESNSFPNWALDSLVL